MSSQSHRPGTMKSAFYQSPSYKKKQSTLTKKLWKRGLYGHLRRKTSRICARKECRKSFIVVPSDPGRFCSQSCAAKTNNLQKSQGPPISKNQLIKLYQNGASSTEIAKKLNVSPNKIDYWLRKFQVPKRSISEAIYLKHNPNGDPFSIKENLTPKEKQLLGLGLGIYWGEGNKTSKYNVGISNSDPELILKFIEFLIRICQINTNKLKFSLLAFNDIDPEKALKYWCRKLNISEDKFSKTTIIPPQGKGTYKKKSKYGVCMVAFNNIKLKKWIMSQLG